MLALRGSWASYIRDVVSLRLPRASEDCGVCYLLPVTGDLEERRSCARTTATVTTRDPQESRFSRLVSAPNLH